MLISNKLKIILLVFFCNFANSLCTNQSEDKILLDEDFRDLKVGMFSSGVVGAHAEYHYIPETAPKGNWEVSCFRSNLSQRGWQVIMENGERFMYQTYCVPLEERKYYHPIIVTGDMLWKNYQIKAQFAPSSDRGQSGVLFRYRNDRCYYFFGVDGQKAILKTVYHGRSFRTQNTQILDQMDFSWQPNQTLTACIRVQGQRIEAHFDEHTILFAQDTTFLSGRIGLTSDIPTRFKRVVVTTTSVVKKEYDEEYNRIKKELEQLQSFNPQMVVWKRLRTDGFGVGRNLRFGDLNNDDQIDLLIGQVKHHGPKDRNSEVGCLTAMTFDGNILWQNGEPDLWKDNLTNDVGFQIHDLDGDGRTEVIYCRDFEIVVADGATGITKYKAPTPINKIKDPPYNKFDRILGDCLFFFDCRGTKHDRDILIKDRYQNFWILNDHLELLWEGSCVTGHYPFAYDIDEDGKDELAIGYSLYDDDGILLWSLDDQIQDHCDGVAIVNYHQNPNTKPIIMNAASDEGMLFLDLQGTILKHYYIGHVQNPAVANFRDDLPGLETVSINFWANQGIIHYFNSNGDIYYDFEPVQHGSMMLPINWTGYSEEYFVLSASPIEGGLFDGNGNKLVEFPADGHPELCNAILDLTGDCRDEIVVWDPFEIWIYTQDDNPKQGKLYKPIRNPLYNYSNYQATVSLPGWSE